jgi:hypothetical protein
VRGIISPLHYKKKKKKKKNVGKMKDSKITPLKVVKLLKIYNKIKKQKQ